MLVMALLAHTNDESLSYNSLKNVLLVKGQHGSFVFKRNDGLKQEWQFQCAMHFSQSKFNRMYIHPADMVTILTVQIRCVKCIFKGTSICGD